jgi:fructose-1,6-bisphosphatase/sedoheptulose 1,7-bisphosphatase-like protein
MMGSAYVVPMPMHKQMVSLTLPQIAALKKEAKRLGVSVSELIRRIVDRHRLG